MTTHLQQALLDDNVLVIQEKIRLGSYPHVVYSKALGLHAWKCAQWIANAHPKKLTPSQWAELARDTNVIVDFDIVQSVHLFGIGGGDKTIAKQLTDPRTLLRCWKRSVIAWESRGVHFPVALYVALWAIPGVSFQTRRYVVDLGKMHRFEPVEAWLNSTYPPTDKEHNDVFRQLWDHAILHYDKHLLGWLSRRATRAVQMDYLYNSLTLRSLVLPSMLFRRKLATPWDLDTFLQQGVTGIFSGVDEFCMYVALYDSNRLRQIWSRMEASLVIPEPWKRFLSSGATSAEPDNEMHRLVVVLRGLFPTDEIARMSYSALPNLGNTLPETNLVDLL